jgi:hypothetical protein
VQRHFTTAEGTDWSSVFLVPVAITVACAVAFLLFFKEDRVPRARVVSEA